MSATPEYSLADMRMDAADAFERAARYHAELKEIYRFFMPWRIPTTDRSGSAGQGSEGKSLGNEMLFDATGLSAAAAFSANMQADWFPHFENLFKLEAGPLYPGDATDYNLALEAASKIVHGLLPQTRVNSLEMLQDLFAGTGAMFMEPGEKGRDPIRSVAVPILELAMSSSPWGGIDRWFWRRMHKARHLPQLWPDGKFGERLNRLIKDTPKADIEVVQYTYWCPHEKRYQLRVWTNLQGDDTVLRQASYRVSPWITPRMFVVPGEAFGRGLAHLGLPNAKTLNKSRELALRAAAMSLLGLWVGRHDGVFNPSTVKLVPGAILKVAHTSGPLKSIDRLDVPKNFDVASFVTRDEREQLNRVLLNDDLPDLADTVKSPTEIAARLRRLALSRGGNTVRLGHEMVMPIAIRAVDIAEELGLLPTNLRIDQVGTQVTVLSPAAVAARSGKVERVTQWLQMTVGLFGPQAAMLAAEVEKVIPQMGRWLGVDEEFIRSKGSTDELKQMIAQYAGQIAASEQAKSAQAQAQAPAAQVQDPQQYLQGGI